MNEKQTILEELLKVEQSKIYLDEINGKLRDLKKDIFEKLKYHLPNKFPVNFVPEKEPLINYIKILETHISDNSRLYLEYGKLEVQDVLKAIKRTDQKLEDILTNE